MQEKPISNYISTSPFIKSHCFVGICLGGAKKDTTSVAVLEYYPKEKKVFLRHIYSHIKSTQKDSSDKLVYDFLEDSFSRIELVLFNAPLSLPQCMTCSLPCPGYEVCNQSHILWSWKFFHRYKKKRTKIFSPYIERCSETYISKELDESFEISPALNSNKAPLTARAHFLSRRLEHVKNEEFLAKVSLWYLGRSLKISKIRLRNYKSSFEGRETRRLILDKISERGLIFFYEQDRRLMEKSHYNFEAFLGAFTGVLSFVKQCQKPPKNFPKEEKWIQFPVEKLDWSFLNIEKSDKIKGR